MRFASLLSGGFITAIVTNPPEIGKTHLCALLMFLSFYPEIKKFNNIINIKAIFSFFVNNVGILRVKLFIKIVKLLLSLKVKNGDTITVTYKSFVKCIKPIFFS